MTTAQGRALKCKHLYKILRLLLIKQNYVEVCERINGKRGNYNISTCEILKECTNLEGNGL
jgi:hypothetical protein